MCSLFLICTKTYFFRISFFPKYIINNFDPNQVAFCLDDDIGNANKLDDSGFEVYLNPNYGLYTEETLNRKINKGVKVIAYESKINDVLL